LLNSGRPREAEEQYQEALKLRPDFPLAARGLESARQMR
jgi:hypothetical protein